MEPPLTPLHTLYHWSYITPYSIHYQNCRYEYTYCLLLHLHDGFNINIKNRLQSHVMCRPVFLLSLYFLPLLFTFLSLCRFWLASTNAPIVFFEWPCGRLWMPASTNTWSEFNSFSLQSPSFNRAVSCCDCAMEQIDANSSMCIWSGLSHTHCGKRRSMTNRNCNQTIKNF